MELGAGKVAVVTGAGSGIGLALAESFARQGCSMVLADVQTDALAAAESTIGALGVDTLALEVDVSDRDQVAGLAASTVERFGGVHVVCNNAGVASPGDPWLGGLESWEWTMGVNFWGVVYGVKTFLPHLVESGGGHIVNTASIAGLYPGFSAPYDASKHAVVALTESLYHSMTVAGLPIGVSCLCPGWVRTGIVEADRNWPSHLGPLPVRDAAAEVGHKYVSRAIDEGMQPGAVADLVVSAVQEERFWVFPHQDFLDIAMERFHSIGEHANPVQPEETPGMPPRSQVIEEMMTAMLGAAEAGGAS
ncbi:MAG: SDR family NAD(P)-dependent oxidoreductase [Actinomycetota bacterium]